jgi:acyl dehydratase
MPEISLETYQTMVGTRVGTSRWFEITQKQIDQFADVTEDWQYIHLDPERAAQTPFGGTVAHGFLTLSMLSAMFYDAVPDFEKTTMGVNYGFDRLRFLSPVLAGARIRAHFDLTELTQARPAEITTKWDTTIEIEGQTRPALSALWICRTYLEKT